MSLMMREIHEQPVVLEHTLRQERSKLKRFHDLARRRSFQLVVLVARGTSDNAALFGRYLIEITTGLPVSLAAPSVYTLYHTKLQLARALVVGISQSGEGTDINLVLEACRKQGALTVGITNRARSTMAHLVDEVFLVHAGPERSVAATKTYTGQLLLLYGLAWALGAGFGEEELVRLPELAARALRLQPGVQEVVERYRFMVHCIVVGRGLNYANAYELSLKLMETCHIVAQRFSCADLMHGPIAMIERGFPIFAFAPAGVTHASMLKLIARMRHLGADVLAIASPGRVPKVANATFVVPGNIEELGTPVPYAVPAQLFAALLAKAKGLSPDKPRHLKKITRTI